MEIIKKIVDDDNTGFSKLLHILLTFWDMHEMHSFKECVKYAFKEILPEQWVIL